MTGLNARVIRVWFQNRRCKEHKRVKAEVLISRKVSLGLRVLHWAFPTVAFLPCLPAMLSHSRGVHCVVLHSYNCRSLGDTWIPDNLFIFLHYSTSVSLLRDAFKKSSKTRGQIFSRWLEKYSGPWHRVVGYVPQSGTKNFAFIGDWA